jgi:hypothetical protein
MYSKFAYLGRLNQYTKDQLIQLVAGYQVRLILKKDTFQVIRIIGDQTRLDITYTLEGEYISILEEEWYGKPHLLVKNN